MFWNLALYHSLVAIKSLFLYLITKCKISIQPLKTVVYILLCRSSHTVSITFTTIFCLWLQIQPKLSISTWKIKSIYWREIKKCTVNGAVLSPHIKGYLVFIHSEIILTIDWLALGALRTYNICSQKHSKYTLHVDTHMHTYVCMYIWREKEREREETPLVP